MDPRGELLLHHLPAGGVRRPIRRAAGVVEPDDGSVPSGDHPFYVRAIFAGINSDCVGRGGVVSLEFIPPLEVSVVNDPAYPPYWTSISPDAAKRSARAPRCCCLKVPTPAASPPS
jgi:hypothetical protein